MRFSWFLLGFLVLGLSAIFRPGFEPGIEQSRPSGVESAQAIIDRLENDTATAQFARSIPGISVAVARAGAVEVEWASGSRSAWSREPVTPDTRFEAASLSKPVTAYAILRLVQQGALDLDAPIEREGFRFTLREVLSHSAGFDNSLRTPPSPVDEGGAFAYAGTGFVFLGEIIETVTGLSFAEHMNSVILPELGMVDSSFGAMPRDADDLAAPHVSLALPVGIVALVMAVIGLPLLAIHGVMRAVFRLGGFWGGPVPGRLIFALALMVGLGAPYLIFGAGNYAVAALSAGAIVGLGAMSALALHVQGISGRITSLVLGGVVVVMLVLRPPIPLAERTPNALPAAGLRTTAADYARFLGAITAPTHLDPALAIEMLSPQIAVTETQSWGLGIGIQTTQAPLAWHWGVNFPGYQALAIADPASGDAVIILMNGGPASFAPGGMRFSGLELARETAMEILGGEHGAYWQDAS